MTEVRKLWRDKASARGSNPSLSIFSQPRRNHEPPQPYRRALLFVAAIFTFTMKFIAAIPIILAYGPAIFDLALTGRGGKDTPLPFVPRPSLIFPSYSQSTHSNLHYRLGLDPVPHLAHWQAKPCNSANWFGGCSVNGVGPQQSG